MTYQDSCNYVRNGGLADIGREIMSYIAEDFREMIPNREPGLTDYDELHLIQIEIIRLTNPRIGGNLPR